MNTVRRLFTNKYVLFFLAFAYLMSQTMLSIRQETTVSGSRIVYLIVLFGYSIYISEKNKDYNTVYKFSFLLAVYMSFMSFFDFEKMSSFISNVLNAFLWVLFLFNVSNMHLSKNLVKYIAIIMSICCNVLAFIFLNLDEDTIRTMNYIQRVAASNSIYYVFGLVPFAFLFKKWWMSLVFLIIPIYTFFESGKTTCLVSTLCFMLYFILFNLKNLKVGQKFALVIIIAIGACILFNYIDFLSFIAGLKEDFSSGGNGRSDIAYSVFALLENDTDVFALFFGHGVNTISKTIGIGGHNDFLEILYCYGIFSLGLLIGICIALLKKTSSVIKEYRVAYIVSLIIFYSSLLASKIFATQMGLIPFALFWGVIFSVSNKRLNYTKE